MILEGLVTSRNEDGSWNLAPLGAVLDESELTDGRPTLLATFMLRPFQSSRTYQNLKRHPFGVWHVCDDIELLAAAALDRLTTLPSLRPATAIEGRVVADVPAWYEFEVQSVNDAQPRTEMQAVIVARGTGPAWGGWNRAQHAVLEGAILASRLGLLPAEEIDAQLRWLTPWVEKTGGPRERAAWNLVLDYIREYRESAAS